MGGRVILTGTGLLYHLPQLTRNFFLPEIFSIFPMGDYEKRPEIFFLGGTEVVQKYTGSTSVPSTTCVLPIYFRGGG